MEPRAGCDDILEARSSASDEGKAVDVAEPGGGSVRTEDTLGSIGLRGERRDIVRAEAEETEVLADVSRGRPQFRRATDRIAGATDGRARAVDSVADRATALRQRKTCIAIAYNNDCRSGVECRRFGCSKPALAPTKSRSGPCTKKYHRG